jgi:hypothetical protein
MSRFIKVQGIYAVALAGYFLDRGDHIVNPPEIVENCFKNHPLIVRSAFPDINICDLDPRCGVRVTGEPEIVLGVLDNLRESFFDAPFITSADSDMLTVKVLFPNCAKLVLDDIRNRFIPTIRRHHQFLSAGFGEWLNKVESVDLTNSPGNRDKLSDSFYQQRVWENYIPGKPLNINHMKPDGALVTLRPGKVVSSDIKNRKLTIKRTGFKGPGRYDGLNADIMPGDYAFTTVCENDWFLLHSYHRKNGRFVGRYFNINTPVDCLPDGISYLDLEIDVVERDKDAKKLVDRDKIERWKATNVLSEKMVETALKTASMLMENDPVC